MANPPWMLVHAQLCCRKPWQPLHNPSCWWCYTCIMQGGLGYNLVIWHLATYCRGNNTLAEKSSHLRSIMYLNLHSMNMSNERPVAILRGSKFSFLDTNTLTLLLIHWSTAHCYKVGCHHEHIYSLTLYEMQYLYSVSSIVDQKDNWVESVANHRWKILQINNLKGMFGEWLPSMYRLHRTRQGLQSWHISHLSTPCHKSRKRLIPKRHFCSHFHFNQSIPCPKYASSQEFTI